VRETAIDGKAFEMKDLKGKVVLVVNIASQCGYTPQLAELQAVFEKYKDKGFTVLGVPTNDFGGQTPEDDMGIKDFCSRNYNATFPILKKATVKGKDKRPLYKYLTEEAPKKFRGEIGWNFEKFLIDQQGEVVARFPSRAKPLAAEITGKIEEQLKGN
jgi:glutathione peroxidase